MQFSDKVLNLLGGPHLSELTRCGAEPTPPPPDFLLNALANLINSAMHPDEAIVHLDLSCLRRTRSAHEAYEAGRIALHEYIEGINTDKQHLRSYHSALTSFERCVSETYQAALAFNAMEHRALSTTPGGATLRQERSVRS